jgi:predicted secreted protein
MADVPAVQNIDDVDLGDGSEFWLAAANEDLHELAMVTEVPMPQEDIDLVEVTHMKSPNRRKEYISGWKDGSEGDVVMNYVPGSPTDILIREAKEAGDRRAYRIVLPTADDGTWEVTGFVIVRAYLPTNPLNDRRTATMTVKFTGAETQAAGA